MEVWRQIYEFPRYSISNEGRVQNNITRRIMRLSVNQFGIVYVGLMDGPTQYKRSVAVLVADAFLPDFDRPDSFDTPIHLDGDKTNCSYDNLKWRPFWFALKYHRQFRSGRIHIRTTIEEEKTGERFRNSMSAAVAYGLLELEVAISTETGEAVWPTYQKFHVVDDRRQQQE